MPKFNHHFKNYFDLIKNNPLIISEGFTGYLFRRKERSNSFLKESQIANAAVSRPPSNLNILKQLFGLVVMFVFPDI